MSKKFRKIGITLALLSIMMLAAACGSQGNSSNQSGSSNTNGSGQVAAVIKGLDNPFFQAMQQGIQDQVKT